VSNLPAPCGYLAAASAYGKVYALFAENTGTNHATPYTWLAGHGFTNEMDSAELLIGSNGIPVWQSYVADLNPTDASSLLRIKALSNLRLKMAFVMGGIVGAGATGVVAEAGRRQKALNLAPGGAAAYRMLPPMR
jgi:hypothetical protein